MAACALSRITSPTCPVMMKRPPPRVRLHSMKRISPPTGVHARAMATPGMPMRWAVSLTNLSGPRSVRTMAAVIRVAPPFAVPAATRWAILRHTAPMARSRLRSPASRVWPSMMRSRAGCVKTMWRRSRPFSVI